VTELLFGLNVSTSAAAGTDPVHDAREAERLGYDFVSANDHPNGSDPTHEMWTMLTWIAAQTSRIGVASRVLGVPYRPPAIVAKMASTLDRLSAERLILGMGGGSSDQGMAALGRDVPTPRAKIDGLEEAVRIMHGLWSKPEFTFEGRIYRTDRAKVEPKPRRRIPIWLGTFGERGLAITGRLADGWIPSLEMAPPNHAKIQRGRVLMAAREAGRDAEEIVCVYNFEIRLDDRTDPRPSIVSGPPAHVVERLVSFVRLGFRGMNFIPRGPGVGEQRQRIAEEVMPAVRAEVS
jgi:alkanesulfonate monooxygenase SsuD/methylene tetrahydromethanopterin reductase-like flavin-dependent oxidoreductase (luciferase family)